MSRIISSTEIFLGAMLLLVAGLLFASPWSCGDDNAACGMVEPLVAVWIVLPLAICMVAAGLLHRRGQVAAGVLAYLPFLAMLAYLFGQARQWW